MANRRIYGLPPIHTLSVPEARRQMHDYLMECQTAEKVHRIKDLTIPCIWGKMDVRIYEPASGPGHKTLIFFHGGGWTLNSIRTYEPLCTILANRTERVVVSPEYRLAPEHKYPAALEDAVSAIQWVHDNAGDLGFSANYIAVGGDSSGAALATAAAMYFRDRGGLKPEKQVLVYPVTDYYMPGTQSYQTYGTSYLIDRDFLIWGWNHYIRSTDDLSNPYLCPLRADDLSHMPDTLIITAGQDALRDEGELYGEKLRECGCSVTMHRYDKMMHGFLMNPRLSGTKKALAEIAAFLKDT